jgi:hypothetical protein
MKHRKKLEQRTFLQDRFEILMKKQKTGKATFNELTELDEIVNKNAAIRERILEEMQGFNDPSNDLISDDILCGMKKQPNGLLAIIKSIINRLFILKSSFTLSFLYAGRCNLTF